jgi:hypothetical protein
MVLCSIRISWKILVAGSNPVGYARIPLPTRRILKVAIISFYFRFGPCAARRNRTMTAASTEWPKKP